MLRRSSALLTLALLLVPAAGVLAAGQPSSSDVTLKGELIDMACYIGHGAKGTMHKTCAQKCADMGQPVALLTTEGKLYVLVADHTDAAPYEKARKLAGEQAEIKGESAEKDGVNIVTVHDVKKS